MPRKTKNTQQAAQEIVEEIKEKPQKRAGFVVYAPFDTYSKGDSFVPPAGWQRDRAHEELLINKQKRRQGVVFLKEDGNRVVLPLKEA